MLPTFPGAFVSMPSILPQNSGRQQMKSGIPLLPMPKFCGMKYQMSLAFKYALTAALTRPSGVWLTTEQ